VANLGAVENDLSKRCKHEVVRNMKRRVINPYKTNLTLPADSNLVSSKESIEVLENSIHEN
jgi:hypothetical protein